MTDRAALAGLIDRFSGVSVLCLGDVMLDRFVYGTVDRISPEGPIPILRVDRETAMLGGAGNVVRNLVALGVRPTFVSAIGDDAAGREVSGLIAKIAEVEPYLAVARGRETTIKTRYIASGQQLLRTDRETVAEMPASVAGDLRHMAVEAVGDAAAVILSDYGKGALSGGLIEAVTAAARAAGKPLVVDPKGADYDRYRGATVATPNRAELALAAGVAVTDQAAIMATAEALIAACGIDALLVTRGADGMTLVGPGAALVHLPAEAREVYDVSGAGDTVVAVLGAALGAGIALREAARLANAAAGIVVGKAGTAVVTAGEVFGALHAQDLLSGEAKVAALADAVAHVSSWRKDELKIGFTNGVFDLLHPGHVALLSQARAGCDRLVVGLNSDASVAALKGPGRPIQHEASRAAVLASLASVDLVVIFGADTPVDLIEALRPDVLIKGADYRLEDVVGAELVRNYGGTVLLADIVPGHSTTATISRLAT